MEQLTGMLLIGALIYKSVDLLRYAFNRDFNGVITQVVTWIVAIGAVFAVAESQWANDGTVFEVDLSEANVATKALLGFAAGSLASVLNDARKVFDSTGSAELPKLVDRRPEGDHFSE